MDSIIHQLAGTVILRPYVFAFLLAYLIGCSLHMGVKRAALFCIAGYLIAWLSEYSSIHNGIPYGYYYYIEQTRGKELWVLGVPFMDSLSYVFLAYASYAMALLSISPLVYSRGALCLLETRAIRNSFSARALGALFQVYLDIIIDPVALQGNKWFLGQIYGYPEPGMYFGVPVSNFAGWYVVGFLMIAALQKIDKYLHDRGIRDYPVRRHPLGYLAGPALYLGVLIFNLSVTFSIRDYALGWTGVFILLLPSVLLVQSIRAKISAGVQEEALRAHARDFPQARGAKESV